MDATPGGGSVAELRRGAAFSDSTDRLGPGEGPGPRRALRADTTGEDGRALELQGFLLSCLRGEPPIDAPPRGPWLDEETGSVLSEWTKRLGVAPILFKRLKASGVPVSALGGAGDVLRQAYLRNAARNLRLLRDLSGILTELAARSIPVIVLKGGYLLENVYRNLGLRFMLDVDLLVRRSDLDGAAAALEALEYRPMHGYRADHEAARFKDLPGFLRPGSVPVEIHWSVTDPGCGFEIDAEELWEGARPARIAGVACLSLPPENLLLHLCYHASYHHNFEFGLRPFCDLAELTRSSGDDLDWNVVVERAERWRWARGVGLTLLFSREWLGAEVPDRVTDRLLAGCDPRAIEREVRMRVMGEPEKYEGTPVTTVMARFWGEESWIGKVRVLFWTCFPSREMLGRIYRVDSRSPLIHLQHVRRLASLLAKYSGALWRLAAGRGPMREVADTRAGIQQWLRASLTGRDR